MSSPDALVLDTVGMFDAAFGLPDQMAAAVEIASAVDGLPDASKITSLLMVGMGGSGISGDVVSLVATDHGRVPIDVSRHYELPAYVGPNTLVMAVSFSGGTEETVVATEAAIAASEALKILLNRGKVWAAPHGIQYDGYRNKFAHTWRPGGNGNPINRIAIAIAKQQFSQK